MDTIVAVSTAIGSGAISIVRLSGLEAIKIVASCFKGSNLTKAKSHTIHYGHLYDDNGFLDEVLVSIFLSPKTYTTEDVVEINCHGGILVTNKILELMIQKGARIAEAGEFTKRAFLNGRIDLTKAEAVMDVINSQTENSLKCSVNALRGDVCELINSYRTRLVECIAKIEVNIDYPEYEDEIIITNEYLKPRLELLRVELEEILLKAKTSTIIKEGITTAIIGRPNVGKSSMLNRLLREDKAIVTDIAGTTRDVVEGKLNVGGVILNLLDTAGIRSTFDEVERIGVLKTREIIIKAQLVILVLENNQKLSEVDKELLEMTKNKNRIIVINKTDLPTAIDYQGEAIKVSLLSEKASLEIEKKIKEIYKIADLNSLDATYISNVRQISKIKEALNNIKEALLAIDENYPVDVINIDITKAWKNLGEIIGEDSPEELINTLFANFCLGK